MQTKQTVSLQFLPEYNAYGISDKEVKKLTDRNIIPILELSNEALQELAPDTEVRKGGPVVAFLMGREKGHYTVDMPYLKAMAQSGASLRFLTYNENLDQMDDINGLILPGGAFDSPNEFYTDPLKPNGSRPGTRSHAYTSSIMKAEKTVCRFWESAPAPSFWEACTACVCIAALRNTPKRRWNIKPKNWPRTMYLLHRLRLWPTLSAKDIF